MKGATADPSVKTIKVPSKSIMSIMGASQNFFRTFIYPQRSFRRSNINKAFLYDFFQVDEIQHDSSFHLA